MYTTMSSTVGATYTLACSNAFVLFGIGIGARLRSRILQSWLSEQRASRTGRFGSTICWGGQCAMQWCSHGLYTDTFPKHKHPLSTHKEMIAGVFAMKQVASTAF
ncbi:hypothetical protein DAPPUDRAFT_252396 [Daphnia pulex]|uniref:Uncharacterized protein n=1 Tax=Daphnia pulex TaxID=6669 RepID=E9H2L3_DAPPU|nr:hypothetical protein DAPPUDRAFT_252396 [Daphnia pulex]|eukprot:EFX74045.1 hypothetical protein DAPPUDRAFT_252396 [Daphnia pulex]